MTNTYPQKNITPNPSYLKRGDADISPTSLKGGFKVLGGECDKIRL